MTILQLITRRQYRGAEVFAGQLSEQLLQRGHSIIFAGLYPPPAEALAPEGMEHIDLNGHRFGTLPNLLLLRRIAKIVEEQQVDLVQANASDNLKYAVLSRKIFGWKASIIYRNASVLSEWTRSALHRRVNRWLLNDCEAIACVSRETMRDLKERVGVNPDLLHHLPIGTPIPEEMDKVQSRQYLNQWVPVTEKDKVLIHVGSFTPEKNHRGLLRIFDELEKKVAPPLKLILVGDGPLRFQVEEKIKRRGRPTSIYTLGQRKDIPKLLSAADLFLLPSLIEGTPAVLLEASTQRLPSIVFDVGAVRECFPETVLADLLVAKNDESAFIEKAIQLLENPILLKKLGVQLRAFILEHYAMEKIADQFGQLYAAILNDELEKEKSQDRLHS